MTHEMVAIAIRKLGLQSEAQHNAGYGLPSIDIALEAEDGRDIALMVPLNPPNLPSNVFYPYTAKFLDQMNARRCEGAQGGYHELARTMQIFLSSAFGWCYH
jgi:hypothetical protein